VDQFSGSVVLVVDDVELVVVVLPFPRLPPSSPSSLPSPSGSVVVVVELVVVVVPSSTVRWA